MNLMRVSPLLETLNPSQKLAVEQAEGPVLILAGAGTGKTRTLIARFSHLIQANKADLGNILLVTFTNKAAHEMKERAYAILQRPMGGSWIGTFHAICLRILRTHADALGMSPNFSIIDMDDQLKLVKQIIQGEGLLDKSMSKQAAYLMGRYADRGYLTGADVPSSEPETFRQFYDVYRKRLRNIHAFDFGGIILGVIELLQKHPDIRASYQNIFRYLMVDEYQDTNAAQYQLLKLFVNEQNNICCVGDEDQSIYEWRGANIENILRFEKDFVGAKVIRLEHNYRSSENIVNTASKLIANNSQRLGKTITSAQPVGSPNGKVTVQGSWDTDDEARLVVDQIERLRKQNVPLSQIGILVRVSFQTREFEERLTRFNIPYKLVGGMNFYERQEIRDAMAYLRLVIQPNDGIAFERILNLPKRGIGLTSINRIHDLTIQENIPFPKAAEVFAQQEGHPSSKLAMNAFLMQVNQWRAKAQELNHVELARYVLEDSGYMAMWRNDKSKEAAARLDNLKEFLNAMSAYDNLTHFMEHVCLLIDNSPEKTGDAIRIMTLHGAKGLEFDYIFLPGWEEGIFPHSRALAENGDRGLEEERRLAYVGITRARHGVYISYTMQRRFYHSWQTNVPSRFIKELPQEHIQHFNPNGIEIHSAPQEGFVIGERVYHEKYGNGDIVDLDEYGLYIKFDNAGIKKISHKFVAKAC